VLPVTVAVNACVAPARRVAVAGVTATDKLLDGPVTVSFTTADAINPGFGFCTVRFTEPTCAEVAVPVAVNCVAEIRVVVSAVVPNISVAPGAKLVPFTVNVKATPDATEVGVTEVIVGVGLLSVTTLLPVAFALPVSAALTVMVFALGGNCGAVYTPAAVIVPVSAAPPATPFTDHANVAVVLSLAFAVNVCVAPPCKVAVAGVTVTPLLCGVGWFGSLPPPLFLLLPNPAHPAATSAAPAIAAIQMRLTACPQVDSVACFFLATREVSRNFSNRWIKLWWD